MEQLRFTERDRQMQKERERVRKRRKEVSGIMVYMAEKKEKDKTQNNIPQRKKYPRKIQLNEGWLYNSFFP